jgi:hypothetical protein
MAFIYCTLIIAVLLLANIRRIERIFLKHDNTNKNTSVNYNHAHNLVIDIGNTLLNTEGVQQYKELKPKLEQVKIYYVNANNQSINTERKATENKLSQVKLKVVS